MGLEATKLLNAAPLQPGCNNNNLVVLLASMDAYPIARAIAADPFGGSQSKFAAAIGTSQQNISNWVRKGSPLPAELVLKAEEATAIPRHVWRPDISPTPSEARAA